jgi:hypothetical protein
VITECAACLEGDHQDCDTGAWTDIGEPVICACWARTGHVQTAEQRAMLSTYTSEDADDGRDLYRDEERP